MSARRALQRAGRRLWGLQPSALHEGRRVRVAARPLRSPSLAARVHRVLRLDRVPAAMELRARSAKLSIEPMCRVSARPSERLRKRRAWSSMLVPTAGVRLRIECRLRRRLRVQRGRRVRGGQPPPRLRCGGREGGRRPTGGRHTAVRPAALRRRRRMRDRRSAVGASRARRSARGVGGARRGPPTFSKTLARHAPPSVALGGASRRTSGRHFFSVERPTPFTRRRSSTR